jgi:hypothetical protein
MVVTNRKKQIETTSRATSPIHRKRDLFAAATVTTITPTFISRTFPGCSRSFSLRSRDIVPNTKLFYNNNNNNEPNNRSAMKDDNGSTRRKSFESGIDRLSSRSTSESQSIPTNVKALVFTAGYEGLNDDDDDDSVVEKNNYKNSQRKRHESINSINSFSSNLSLGKKCKYYNNLSYSRTLSRENSFIVVDSKNREGVVSTIAQQPVTTSNKSDMYNLRCL